MGDLGVFRGVGRCCGGLSVMLKWCKALPSHAATSVSPACGMWDADNVNLLQGLRGGREGGRRRVRRHGDKRRERRIS